MAKSVMRFFAVSLLLLSSASFIGGCGQSSKMNLSESFSSGAIFYPGQSMTNDQTSEDLENKRSSLFGDKDNDGQPDALDPDIDGDGVLNLLDKSPLDAGNSEMQEHVTLKIDGNIYYLITGNGQISTTELTYLKTLLKKLQKTSPGFADQLKVIALWNWNDDYDNMNGHFDPYWKTIRIRPSSQFKGGSEQFLNVLTHEAFHAFQHSQVLIYLNFLLKTGWTEEEDGSAEFSSKDAHWQTGDDQKIVQRSPVPNVLVTRRSMTSPRESFADSFALAYQEINQPALLETGYFDNLESYKKSELHAWTLKTLQAFLAK